MAATVRASSAPTVLVVDDEQDIRDMCAEILALEGYHVRTARNGKDALKEAREHPPNLIVVDLMMPVMNGWQFLKAKQADASLAAVPVVVLTAFADSHVEGAAVLLRKPFDLEALLTAAARLCCDEYEPFAYRAAHSS
jgi:two-component system, OmpR family, alkaline phosphatase synthesis response regulator PhoP